MKRFITISYSFLLLIGMSTNEISAQNLIKGGIGLNIHAGNGGSGSSMIFGAGYERAINDKLSTSAMITSLIGFGDFLSFLYIVSEVKYFITDEAFNGFYAGAYLGLGIRSAYTYVTIGPEVGYMLKVTDKLVLDAFGRVGYGSLTFNNTFAGKNKFRGLNFAVGATIGFEL